MPGESKEDALAEMFRFSLPDGDAGVVTSRKDVQYHPRGTSTFAPEETMEFELDPGKQAIDPRHCWISARLALTDASAAALSLHADAHTYSPYPELPAGTAGLISRLQIMTKNGDILEDIENYNHLAYLVDSYTLSPEWRANEGQDECFPFPRELEPTDVPQNHNATTWAATTYTNVATGQETDSLSFRSSGHATRRKMLRMVYNATSTTAPVVKIKLRLSALFGGKTIIPPALGPLIIKITLAKADVAFTTYDYKQYTFGLRSDATDALQPDTGTRRGSNGLRIGAASRASATASDFAHDAQYRIWQPKFNVRTLELSSTFRDAMNKAVNGSGLPRVISTWFTTQTTLAASNVNAPLSVTANKVTANARAAIVQINPTTLSTMADATGKQWSRNSFDCVDHGMDTWRFRLGTEYFPDRYVDNPMDALTRTRDAIPMLGDKKVSGVPALRYDASLIYLGGQAGSEVIGDGTDYKTHAFTVYPEYQANQVARGVSFQNVQGMDLSGLSTNQGTQIELQATWDTASSGDAWVHKQSLHAAVLRLHVYYTRLIVIQANGISIRE